MLGDTFVANHFVIELGKFQVATFQEVSGLQVGSDVVETQQVSPTGDLIERKQPGPRATGQITLSRAMDQNTTLLDWVNTTSEKGDLDTARQNVSIAILDSQKNVARRFNLANAWASEWSGPGLAASSGSAAVESVTIVYEEITAE
ncbi:phage tail protein [Streptomyces roseifaciens]